LRYIVGDHPPHLSVIAGSLPPGFMPAELTNHHREEFKFEEVPVEEVLQGNYSDLDPDCASLIKHCVDRMPWRLYVHQPYEYWHKGKACILGDAAHPMPVSNIHPFIPGILFLDSVEKAASSPRGLSGHRGRCCTRHHLFQ
jgi:hypothetical protein